MDDGIIRIYKDMKHVKLFESFLEEKPRSIIIEITEEFKRRMKESKNSEGNYGFSTYNSNIELFNDGNEYNPRYNMVKVGTIPYDLKRNLQFDFWASYMPNANEIYVTQSNCSLKDCQVLDNSAGEMGVIWNTQPILSYAGENGQTLFSSGYYCKFENGFNVGDVDHRGYFRIVSVS